MYASHFGLRSEPFSIAPDPRYLFMSERHREALAHLLYGVRGGGGFVLLTGEIGAGKTTVCRAFLQQLPPDCLAAYVFNPRLTAVELLQTVCEDFGLGAIEATTVKPLVDALNAFLLREHAAGRQCVLVIDEAQNLGPELLEQLRLLTNLETSERKLLQIVLVGQPELQQTLAGMEQLAQRVIARYRLQALSEAETRQYVEHRLSVAGLGGPLPFDAGALRRIHALTQGVPRRINLLCDRALLGAYAQGRREADAATVRQAAAEVFNLPPRRHRAVVAAAALAGVVGVGAIVWSGLHRPGPATTLARADAAASAPTAASAAASAVPDGPVATAASAAPAASAPLPLAGLPSENAAWRELAVLWKLPVEQADACAASAGQRVGCFRGSGLGLTQLRQFDRPGLLALRDAQGRPTWALLVALDERQATLRAHGREMSVPLTALAPLWQGEWASFWRAPPGYARALGAGDEGAAVPALATLLAKAQGRPEPKTPPRRLDGALLAQLRAFQLAAGLQPDGVAGPGTFMLLNRAGGLDEPRLLKAP
ncbi:ExeA family protein [Azohydromonas caseinilytica]|uniref:AAA family ATPase n=1 Tax=Azohydromonas caseinilytica TaxID=2728836 RepID=A0A848F5V8_9BURK|nr:ExeA family protein [Azohydromonas caseinilytica]NML14782.1 AAA family ATPase [Azohydromonas caseinilytica]